MHRRKKRVKKRFFFNNLNASEAGDIFRSFLKKHLHIQNKSLERERLYDCKNLGQYLCSVSTEKE